MPPPRGLAGFLSKRDLRGDNAEEPDAELGLIGRDGDNGVPVADVLHLGDEGAGGRGVGGAETKYEKADGNGKSSLAK